MKKLGILTYHYSINEGAMLQAYALQEECQRIFPDFQVEMINYESLAAKRRDLLNCFKKPLTLKSVTANIRRLRNLSLFKEKIFSFGSKQLVSDDYEDCIRFINQQNYDGIIVGSDEVWKIRKKSASAVRKFPNIYWLSNSLNAKKFSYAASANKTNYKKLDSKIKSFITQSFKSYSLIGVRDQLTYELVLNCLSETDKVFKVADPTLLINQFNYRPIEDKLKERKFDFSKFTVILNLEVPDLCRTATSFFKERGWQVISVTAYSDYADINFVDVLDPLEWVSIINHCHFYVTERFHGTIFSISKKVPFLAIDRSKKIDKSKTSKLQSLLDDFQLTENLFTYVENSFSEEELWKKLEYALKDTDFSHVDDLIDSYRRQSLEYLRKIGVELCL